MIKGVSHHRAWEGPRVLPVFDQDLPVYDGALDPVSQLPDTPSTGREVSDYVLIHGFDCLWVEDRDVSGHARAKQPTVEDAKG